MTDEEIAIARIVAEKEEKLDKKDMIVVRKTEKIVPRWFHKYLKMFEKKESERMLTRKAWDHAIDLREGFMLKKGKIYPLLRVEREKVQEFVKDQLKKGIYKTIKVTTNITSVLCVKEEWEEEDGVGLPISEQLDNQEQLPIATDFRFNR